MRCRHETPFPCVPVSEEVNTKWLAIMYKPVLGGSWLLWRSSSSLKRIRSVPGPQKNGTLGPVHIRFLKKINPCSNSAQRTRMHFFLVSFVSKIWWYNFPLNWKQMYWREPNTYRLLTTCVQQWASTFLIDFVSKLASPILEICLSKSRWGH